MRGVAIYAAIFAAALVLFLLLPQLDLWFRGCSMHRGRGFVLESWPPIILVYRSVPWVAWGIVLVTAGAAIWLFLVGRPLWRFDRKALLFVAFSTALGPGFLANTVLKDHWGRARPVQIEAFGGPHHFTPAPLPAAECARNCSFVSGHAALGFSLVAFAFLLQPGPPRRRGIGAALAVGGVVGLVRIAQGAHFLSDVVFAGLLVFGTTALLYWWIVERDGFAAPSLLQLYREIGRGSALAWRFGCQSWRSPAVRLGTAAFVTTILVVVSIGSVDRPLALFLHARDADLHAAFELIGRLGEAWGWLLFFALAFAGLHWGGELPRLRPIVVPMRALSALPAFLFASIAASGLVVDVMKIGFGRLRPKVAVPIGSVRIYLVWLAARSLVISLGPQRHDRGPIQRPMVAVAAASAVLRLGGGDRRREQGRGRCTLSERRDGRGARRSVVDTVCGARVCALGHRSGRFPPRPVRCGPDAALALPTLCRDGGRRAGGLGPAAKAGN